MPCGRSRLCGRISCRIWRDRKARNSRYSKKLLKNGHAEHIHAHCDCEFAVRFDRRTSVAGYDPEKYLKQYRDAGSDVNAMRRIDCAARKDAINAQKRAAYAARKNMLLVLLPAMTERSISIVHAMHDHLL